MKKAILAILIAGLMAATMFSALSVSGYAVPPVSSGSTGTIRLEVALHGWSAGFPGSTVTCDGPGGYHDEGTIGDQWSPSYTFEVPQFGWYTVEVIPEDEEKYSSSSTDVDVTGFYTHIWLWVGLKSFPFSQPSQIEPVLIPGNNGDLVLR